ncbi:hypothetical protein EPI10_000823 [Gossypium australe]|uniref:Uncharacterized protein n=1 Tax=Gossypium australe TaxID=47621 RepID=A0A5B6V914_9ROSI|nr:hypothetical protein EPI10_000823 [Gossypium australe]
MRKGILPNEDLNDLDLNDDPIGQDVNPSTYHVIDDRNKPIREHIPILDDLNLRIFGGLPTKDPRLHLRLFLEVCDLFRQQGVPEDALRFKLMVVDACVNGTLLDKSYNEAYEILEKIANNDYQYPTTRVGIGDKVASALELDAITSLTAQGQASCSSSIEALLKEYMAKNDACKSITLRSGTQLDDVVHDTTVEEDNSKLNHGKNLESTKKNTTPEKDVLKQLHINIPLVEALEHMPNYVKFMKDILLKKCRLGEFKTISLTEGKLGIGKARPITVTLQLVDRSYAHPEGKIEDVLERKGELTIRVNDQHITFNVFDALKYAADNKECHAIVLIEITIEAKFVKFCHKNSDSDEDSTERSDVINFDDIGELMEAKQFVDRLGKNFKSFDLSD